MTSVALLHAYSAHNLGDGLLVDESIALLRDAIGPRVEIEIFASDPSSFAHLGHPVHATKPGGRGWDRAYLKALRGLDRFDLIVGVGGGYLRGGYPTEALKCALVMGPQLWTAGRARRPSVYLPQSVGPFRFGTRGLARSLIRRIDTYFLRDPRSAAELALPNVRRCPDLAIVSPEFTRSLGAEANPAIHPQAVLTARAVRGRVPQPVHGLVAELGARGVPLAGYVQSSIGGNDDTTAQRALTGDDRLTRDEYLRRGAHSQEAPRVVVAVRLHAALMALRAGHLVIHLAYERKGFAAFADLDLTPWLHPVGGFSPAAVAEQVQRLLTDERERARYRERLAAVRPQLEASYSGLVAAVRDAARCG